MRRPEDDRPVPGQQLARRGIRVACAGIRDRGAQVQIEWIPGHAGVPGNELANSWTVEEAQRSERMSMERKSRRSTVGQKERVSLVFLKALRKEAVKEWREEITRRGNGNRSFRVPAEGETPRISAELRKIPKELAFRFFQLASSHATIAPFIKEKVGWIDSDTCWWCGSGRQTREYLFKECIAWESEIQELWKRVGEISDRERESGTSRYKGWKGFFMGWTGRQAGMARRPGNTPVRSLLADRRFIGPALDFLRSTRVGMVKEGVVLSSGTP